MMILTDADKAEAKALGLTQEEMRFALAAHVVPERYAFRKAAIQHDREAYVSQVEELGAALTDHLRHAVVRPDTGQVLADDED